MIFGSGGEDEFVSSLPKLRKEIRYMISDEDRRDSIAVLIDGYEAAIRGYEEEKARMQKQVNKVSTDRNILSEDFLRYYDEYYQSRVKLISSLIDYRLLFQQQVTDLELMRVIEDEVKTTADQRREEQIREEKTEDELNEAFQQIADIIVNNIVNSENSETIKQNFFEFESSMYDYLDTSRDLESERQAMLLNTDPTKEELEAMYDKPNRLRYNAARDFALLREAVIMSSTEKEWKQINKDLKKYFKF